MFGERARLTGGATLGLKARPRPCPAHSFLCSSMPPALDARRTRPAATLRFSTMGAYLSTASRLTYGAAGAIKGIFSGLLHAVRTAIAPLWPRKGRLQHPFAASLLQPHRCRLQRTYRRHQHASSSAQRGHAGHAAAACQLRPC